MFMNDRSQWMMGLPEALEDEGPLAFLQKWIIDMFPVECLSSLFGGKEHRVLGKRSPLGDPPRTMLIKMLCSKDKDVISEEAREMPDFLFHYSKNSFVFRFFPEKLGKVLKK